MQTNNQKDPRLKILAIFSQAKEKLEPTLKALNQKNLEPTKAQDLHKEYSAILKQETSSLKETDKSIIQGMLEFSELIHCISVQEPNLHKIKMDDDLEDFALINF